MVVVAAGVVVATVGGGGGRGGGGIIVCGDVLPTKQPAPSPSAGQSDTVSSGATMGGSRLGSLLRLLTAARPTDYSTVLQFCSRFYWYAFSFHDMPRWGIDCHVAPTKYFHDQF